MEFEDPTKGLKTLYGAASSNCLPTKDMLRVKRVQVNELCPVCNNFPESALHIIVLCPHAVASWEKIDSLKAQSSCASFVEWLGKVFMQHRNEDLAVMVMVCWMLWKNRNEVVWNQHSLEPKEVVESALSVLNQWKCVQDRTFDHFLGYMSYEDGDEHWSKPLINSVKVNVDAAIFEETNCFSVAFVARDDKGSLVEARSKCQRGWISADLAQAVGVREALSWVKNEEIFQRSSGD